MASAPRGTSADARFMYVECGPATKEQVEGVLLQVIDDICKQYRDLSLTKTFRINIVVHPKYGPVGYGYFFVEDVRLAWILLGKTPEGKPYTKTVCLPPKLVAPEHLALEADIRSGSTPYVRDQSGNYAEGYHDWTDFLHPVPVITRWTDTPTKKSLRRLWSDIADEEDLFNQIYSDGVKQVEYLIPPPIPIIPYADGQKKLAAEIYIRSIESSNTRKASNASIPTIQEALQLVPSDGIQIKLSRASIKDVNPDEFSRHIVSISALPKWVSEDLLHSIFDVYSSTGSPPRITLRPDSSKPNLFRAYITYNSSTFDAQYALLMHRVLTLHENGKSATVMSGHPGARSY